MTWFKHDTSASTDAKLQILLFDYGATGYGLFSVSNEKLAEFYLGYGIITIYAKSLHAHLAY